MTATSDTIIRLISYSWTDWAVSMNELVAVIGALRADPDMPATIRDLAAAGMLTRMLSNLSQGELAHISAEVLGAGVDAATRPMIENHPNFVGNQHVFRVSADLHASYRMMGARFTRASFNPVPYNDLIPSGATAKTSPFGGVGATGVHAMTLSVPLADQAAMALDHKATLAQYRNPIPGSLPGYLASLTADERRRQAEMLLKRPIVSYVSNSYIAGLPSRADVMRIAAKRYRLHPAMIAAFILAEQRDQSQNEDAVDYAAAQSVLHKDTSIGLGQVVVSTARREDLFSELLSSPFRKHLSGERIADLLTSEEFNIFAVAKYLRLVADRAVTMTGATLPATVAKFPGISFPAYGGPSDRWPDDNIRALGSEYTSKAWDDRLSPGWGGFVFEAYQDIKASGIF